MSNSIDKINAEMVDILEELTVSYEKSKLPEELFVRNFLPFFNGEMDASKNKDFLPLWISIAGSPSSEVDIVDNKNNVVATVPAFLDTSVVNPSKRSEGLDFSQIIALSNMYGNNIPSSGIKVLNDGLSEKFDRLKSKSSNFNNNLDKWNKIFERYKSDKKRTEEKVAKAEIVLNMSNVNDDDFE